MFVYSVDYCMQMNNLKHRKYEWLNKGLCLPSLVVKKKILFKGKYIKHKSYTELDALFKTWLLHLLHIGGWMCG